ncbi:hypothetical protein ATI45_1144 [Marinobacter sp. LV10MA510-1]|uniref:hypothetical protein n=2 Tax=unclassified Marinobacter TaxID=83889 RepID=UPI000BF32326|nr:hypothetical protein [Marinobacter sp. LV10R520-4]PFG08816.1 hypothetical protein ATI45_1144 [Marinobacter sp. LV10MA510-1]PFG54682.1 hypothetical protein ATG98_3975 [Marinobacter sp. LV10R520-4]
MTVCSRTTGFFATTLFSTLALANPDVTSREYKLMLDASQFTYQNEAVAVGQLLAAAEAAIESAIARDVSGSPVLAKQRDVRFFDTQGSCELRQLGYSFRERVENGQSEVTLKFRSPDRYISDYEDLSSTTSGSETKLEADIGATSVVPFKVVYGHSTKAPNTRNLNEIKDVNHHFPGFEVDYGLSDSQSLSLVGNLVVREHVYRGTEIDLGQYDAQISVTLWYQGVPLGAQAPLIGELSFRYEDGSADYTRKVVSRAIRSFEALKSLSSWVSPDSQTKTAFVYGFNPAFCP